MKLSQIIIKEANEPDYTGIDDSIRERLSNYKSHEQQWALTELRKGENIESIVDGLEYYRDKIKDNRFQQIMKPITNPANPKSLTQITLKQIKTGQQQYDAKYGGISKRGAKKKAKETKYEYMSTLINEPDLKVIKIEKTDNTTGAAEAAREIAKGTYWCVSCVETGDDYLKQGPLYYIEYKGSRYLCHVESGQFMDVNDQPHEINIELYRRLAKYSEVEPIIMQDLEHAYIYARDVINGRWPEAEPRIMKKPELAYKYARDVINGRWPEAEKIMMKNPSPHRIYAAYEYAKDVIKGRWSEAENIIIREPYCAYHYARDVINGRWPEAENIIMKYGFYNIDTGPLWYQYARDVIKGRWLEAEQYIKQSAHYWLNTRWWNAYKAYFGIKDET